MSHRIKNARLVLFRMGSHSGWETFLLAMAAWVLLTGHSFVQAQETTPSLTAPEVNSVDPTTPSPLQGGGQARPHKRRQKIHSPPQRRKQAHLQA